jgi:hypothetical protein
LSNISFIVDFALAALGKYSDDVYHLAANIFERVPNPCGNPDHIRSLRNERFVSDGVFDFPSEHDVSFLACVSVPGRSVVRLCFTYGYGRRLKSV